jgi:hypothetical protein
MLISYLIDLILGLTLEKLTNMYGSLFQCCLSNCSHKKENTSSRTVLSRSFFHVLQGGRGRQHLVKKMQACRCILVFVNRTYFLVHNLGLFSASVSLLLSVSIQSMISKGQDTTSFYLGNIYGLLASSEARINEAASVHASSELVRSLKSQKKFFTGLLMENISRAVARKHQGQK